MIILISVLLLLVFSLGILLVRLLQPQFRYLWLISALGSMLAWMLVLAALWVTPNSIPTTIPLIEWQPDAIQLRHTAGEAAPRQV